VAGLLCTAVVARMGVTAGEVALGEELPSSMFGFYLHIYEMPAAVISQVETIRRLFPDSPIYIMSDGGISMDGLCKKHNCTFKLCPPANDRWNPWPFMRRMWDAAVALQTEYMVYLEPDNVVHRPFIQPPPLDAGGMEDANPHLGGYTVDYAELLGRKHRPNFRWNYTGSGLAGGSYFKTSVILDAFSDAAMNDINWTIAECFESKRLYSSDFAMPVVLAARGYAYEPWRDITQHDLNCCTKLQQPRDAALEHFGRGVPGGKPMYNLKLKPEHEGLWSTHTQKYRSNKVVCQGCYDRDQYFKRWGSLECTNRLYEKNPLWPNTIPGQDSGRRCNSAEKNEALAYMRSLLGGEQAHRELAYSRRKWQEENLVHRRQHAKEADAIMEAYLKRTHRTPPPTHPGQPRKPGLD